jgi:DNA polymerase I
MPPSPTAAEALAALAAAGVGRGDLVGLALHPALGVGLAAGEHQHGFETHDPVAIIGPIERELRPRWVVWSLETAVTLARAGVRVATCWDLAAVHRIIYGGWRADPALVWAGIHDRPLDALPKLGPPDLFTPADPQPDSPVSSEGYLKPAWVEGGWSESIGRLSRWADLALLVAAAQRQRLLEMGERAVATARSESAAELLCAEMTVDGLPVDRKEMEGIIAASVGPRPRTEAESAELRSQRDREVLSHLPPGTAFDLRSAGQVKSLLASVGIDVPDTRAGRLREVRDRHPVVEALLTWRKAERIATTYGYAWLDTNVAADGRLRGEWTGSDGAAGRMTASVGLHNMPADMRDAVIAESGHVLVRADLGQIEPRVLAAVSGDAALARATQAEDMYAPVAAQLGVERAVAKVAVLGAMYGQTTGHGAQALRRLSSAYPVAMAYLDQADVAGQVGRDLRTHGGRLILMHVGNANEMTEQVARSQAAARGRYGRNAMVQGAAAEFFKVWAATVRARAARLDARIVLCLHDELLLHVPDQHGEAAAQLLDDCLQESAVRWAPGGQVRFVADVAVIHRWSEAKDP